MVKKGIPQPKTQRRIKLEVLSYSERTGQPSMLVLDIGQYPINLKGAERYISEMGITRRKGRATKSWKLKTFKARRRLIEQYQARWSYYKTQKPISFTKGYLKGKTYKGEQVHEAFIKGVPLARKHQETAHFTLYPSNLVAEKRVCKFEWFLTEYEINPMNWQYVKKYLIADFKHYLKLNKHKNGIFALRKTLFDYCRPFIKLVIDTDIDFNIDIVPFRVVKKPPKYVAVNLKQFSNLFFEMIKDLDDFFSTIQLKEYEIMHYVIKISKFYFDFYRSI